jgi:excinuclease ABC subunit A
VLASERSLTAAYLRGDREIPTPKQRPRRQAGQALRRARRAPAQPARHRRAFPLGTFTCVTGVSGSGKSTLVNDILYAALSRHFYSARVLPGATTASTASSTIDKVVDIDQSPIGRTPRSNPATYTGCSRPIRASSPSCPNRRSAATRPAASAST